MIALWMLHALLIGLLLAGGARALETALRLRAWPRRWVWLAALSATGLLTVVAPLRTGPPVAASDLPVAAVPTAPTRPRGDKADVSFAGRVLHAAQDGLDAPLRYLAVQLDGARSGTADRALAGAWASLSALALLCFAVTLHRARQARLPWPVHEMDGVRVRVAPAEGPLVAGVRRPEIVVPRWLLTAPAAERELVVAHEREHLRAGDPAVLAAGAVIVALFPWNPAAWWMFARLRLATEMDCDARVLRHGFTRAAYGSVLVEVAGRYVGFPLGATAFLKSPSQLERRLIAMDNRFPRFAAARAAGFATLAGALLLAACDASLPSTPEIEAMDVAAAEIRTARFPAVLNAPTVYYLDGERVSSEQGRALDPQRIGAIEVTRAQQPGDSTIIRIRTPEGFAITGDLVLSPTKRVHIRGSRATIDADSVTVKKFEGIMLVDGVRVETTAFRTIDPDRIESIEVLKGAAAERLYSDPRARNGVIRITTKKPGQPTRQ